LRFIDEVVIRIRSGKGGDGIISFHRARSVPKGGPDGGNGGRGGDVIIRAISQLSTLEDAALRGTYHADNGRAGQGSRKKGQNGRNLVLKVPMGTLVWDAEDNRLLTDLIDNNQEFVAASGGKGGLGNVRFASPRNRAPRKCSEGQPGVERQIRLELKLIADVGLVGRPNVGKSTLLTALSRAKPRIAAYPFSTLRPALGIITYGVYRRFVMADIPGLAEGARHGRGLGHRFLRHIERTSLLVILIESTEPDYQSAYDRLIEELEGCSSELVALPRIVVMSKSDLVKEGDEPTSFPFDLEVSGMTGAGLVELVELIANRLERPEAVKN